MFKKKNIKKYVKSVVTSAVLMSSVIGLFGESGTAVAKTMKVSGKSVYVHSSLRRTGASAYTGSDGTVKVSVKSIYISAKNGKLSTPVTKSKNGNSVVIVEFSAPGGAVSKSITSTHTGSYNGSIAKETTADSNY